MNRFSAALSLVLILLGCGPAYAKKTDVVYLHNGDRITGEVKSLIRGKLEFSTQHMGTVLVDWTDIMEIVSDTNQSVELMNGRRMYGPLEKPEDADLLSVGTEQGTVTVDAAEVVSMYPVAATFKDRLDVSASLGLNWDKASDVGKYTVGAEAEHRRPGSVLRGSFNYQLTTQDERDDTVRSSLDVNHFAFRENKRFLGRAPPGQLGLIGGIAGGEALGEQPVPDGRGVLQLEVAPQALGVEGVAAVGADTGDLQDGVVQVHVTAIGSEAIVVCILILNFCCVFPM